MALNQFKSILSASVGNTETLVYTTPVGKKSVLIELDIANRSDDAVIVSIGIATGASAAIEYYIIKNVVIPTGDTFQAVSGQKIVLDGSAELVKLFVVSSALNSVDVIGSLLEDVQ